MIKLSFLIFLIIPISFFIFFNKNIDNKTILNFLGSYSGGSIAGFLTLFGVYYQINNEKKENQENLKTYLKYIVNYNKKQIIENKKTHYLIYLCLKDNRNNIKLLENTFEINSYYLEKNYKTLLKYDFFEEILKLEKKIKKISDIWDYLISQYDEIGNYLEKIKEKTKNEKIKEDIELIETVAYIIFNIIATNNYRIEECKEEHLKKLKNKFQLIDWEVEQKFSQQKEMEQIKFIEEIEKIFNKNNINFEIDKIEEKLSRFIENSKNDDEFIEEIRKIFINDKEIFNKIEQKVIKFTDKIKKIDIEKEDKIIDYFIKKLIDLNDLLAFETKIVENTSEIKEVINYGKNIEKYRDNYKEIKELLDKLSKKLNR